MLSDAVKEGLNLALNEAALLDVQVDRGRLNAMVTLKLCELHSESKSRDGNPVLMVLGGVTRVAVSLRDARWDDASAPALPVALHELSRIVRSFNSQPVYGCNFFDADTDYERWSDRLSLDCQLSAQQSHASITLFQEGTSEGVERHLDMRIWFSKLAMSANGRHLDLEQVIAEGMEFWNW